MNHSPLSERPISIAFEISSDDIVTALESRLGWQLTFDEADALIDALDRAAIEKAALYGLDLETQTEYAHQAIEAQARSLREGGAEPILGRFSLPGEPRFGA